MGFVNRFLVFASALIFFTLNVVHCQDEMQLLRRKPEDEQFSCPDENEITPCNCSSLLIPTISCNGLRTRSLKTIHQALGNRFLNNAIPYLKIIAFDAVGLPSGAFGNITARRLQLRNANLYYVASEAFRGMGSLQFLILENVGLHEIPSDAFSHLPLLVTLSLNDNKISRLTQKDMRYLGKIQHLAAANNRISDIERGSFPVGLVTLSLSNNHLLTLNKTVRNLASLQWLFLSDNRLTNIVGELEGLYDLRILTLGNNLLRILADSFHHLRNLQVLELQHNSIYELGDSLKYLSKLQLLNLSNNILFELDKDVFHDLVSLERLDLSGNYLITLGGTLAPLTRLISLNLSKNSLTEFLVDEICGLDNMRILDLSRNNILVVRPPHNCTQIRRLRILFLQKNALSDLGEFLNLMSQLEDLQVSFNNISRLMGRSFTNSTLIYLNVEGNPLVCDVHQLHVLHELENRKVEIIGMPQCAVDPDTL